MFPLLLKATRSYFILFSDEIRAVPSRTTASTSEHGKPSLALSMSERRGSEAETRPASRGRKAETTKGAVLIPAPMVLLQAGAMSFLGLASAKMAPEGRTRDMAACPSRSVSKKEFCDRQCHQNP